MKFELHELCRVEKGRQIDTALLDESHPYRYFNGGMKESGRYLDYNTEGETVTISEGGASCGYVNYLNERFWCGCHCYRLTDPMVLPKYLYYLLKANQLKIMSMRTGAAMPNIRAKSIRSLALDADMNKNRQEAIIDSLDKIQDSIAFKNSELKNWILWSNPGLTLEG